MKKKNFKLSFIAAAAAGLLALTGCTTGLETSEAGGGGGSSEGYTGVPKQTTPLDAERWVMENLEGKKVMYAGHGEGYPWEDQFLSSFEEQFEQLGIEYQALMGGVDAQAQAQNAQTLLNQDPDVLIVHPGDSSILDSLIRDAQSQGVYVVGLNLITTETADAYVGGNFELGETALAEAMAESCVAQGKNEVAIIRGLSGDGLSIIAGDAYNAVFEKHGLEVVADQAQDYDPTKANDMARVVIQQYPNMCGFIGTWDSMMIGASSAVENAGKTGEIEVYTSDSSIDACNALRDGTMTMALDYGVGLMPDLIVGAVLDLLQTDPGAGNQGSVIFPRYRLLTAETLETDAPHAGCYTGDGL